MNTIKKAKENTSIYAEYTIKTKFDMPEDLKEKLLAELKNNLISIYNPIYCFYDFETNSFLNREEAFDTEKKVVSSYYQFYNLYQTKTHMVITRTSTEYKIDYDDKSKEVLITFVSGTEPSYSYYAALPGVNKPSYFYNEKSKRKLTTENKFFSWSNSNIITVDESLFSNNELQKTSFDKLLKMVVDDQNTSSNSMCKNLLNILKYFNYRNAYPEIDNLIQKDMPYVLDLIENNSNLYNFFFKGNSFKKNFILPKDCLDIIVEYFCKDNYRFYSVLGLFNQMQFHTKNITKEIIEEIYQLYLRGGNNYDYGYSFINSIKTVAVDHKIPLKQIIAYLKRVDDYQALYPCEGIVIWKDYLQSAAQMELDDFDKYPNSLKREHDIFARESVRITNIEEDNRFKKAMEKYQDISYEDDTYCVVVPKDSEDLRLEGRILSHCVGTYVGRVADKRTTIFFVREKENKTKPLYTLEVCNGSIVQFRGKFNSAPNASANVFAKNFVEQCINKHYDLGEVASLAM